MSVCSSLCARILRSKVHSSIDTLPIYYWHKINTTGDLVYLLKKPDGKKLNLFQRIAIKPMWESVYDDYIKRFGLGESFLRILEKRKEIAQLQIEKMLTGDLSIQTFIDICTHELNKLKADIGGSKADFYESKAVMERALGLKLDPMRTSVAEFYSYISTLKKYKPHGRR